MPGPAGGLATFYVVVQHYVSAGVMPQNICVLGTLGLGPSLGASWALQLLDIIPGPHSQS